MITVKRLLYSFIATILIIEHSIAEPIWSTAFGTKGSGDGQLHRPIHMAVDSSGKIHVTEYGNHRVQVFNKDTTFAHKFGASGNDKGQFNNPYGIAIDTKDRIFVSDSKNHRIQIFNNDGTFENSFGADGTTDTTFDTPRGLSINDAGRIYVADTNNQRIQIFNNDGTFKESVNTNGYNPGITHDAEQNIYLIHYPSGLKVLNKDHDTHLDLTAAKYQGVKDGQFNGPEGIAHSSDKTYIADTGNHRIQILDNQGQFLGKLGSQGSGKNQFKKPYDITPTSHGTIYVADGDNDRIVVLFDPTLWSKPGTSVLGTLDLNQDLTLTDGYHLKLQPMEDSSENQPTTSDAKLSLINTTLTAHSGSQITAHSIAVDSGSVLKVNQGTLTTPKIELASGGTFNIDGAHTINYNIGGSGIINKTGDNQLNIHSEVQAEAVNIQQGSAAIVDTTIVTPTFNIAPNSKLKGRGTIIGHVMNNGTISPGFSPGVMNIIGSYTQNGNFKAFISPSANPSIADHSQLAVTGTATITGSNLIVDASDGSYSNGAKYDFLTAGGGVIGGFSNLTLNIVGPYKGNLIYNPNYSSIIISRIYTPALPEDKSFSTKHARDLGNYIDSLTVMNTGLRRVLSNIYQLDTKHLESALKNMEPNRNLTANYVSQDATNLIHSINSARLDIANDPNSVSSFNNSFNFADNQHNTLLNSTTKNNLVSSINSNLSNNLLNSDRHYVWAAPFAQLSKRNSTNHGRGYDVKTGGMIIGYDHKFSSAIITGLSLGYYQAMFEHHDHGGKDNKVKTTFASAYGSKKIGKIYLNGSLLMAYNNNHLKRQINITNLPTSYAHSKHNSYTASPRLELGYNINTNYNYQLTPFIATEYIAIFERGYQEKGADGLNMKMKKNQNHAFNNELGLKLQKSFQTSNNNKLNVRAKLSYINSRHPKAFNKIKTGFIDQTLSYNSPNYSKSEHQIAPGLEFELQKTNGLVMSGSYNGEFSKSFRANGFLLSIGMKF